MSAYIFISVLQYRLAGSAVQTAAGAAGRQLVQHCCSSQTGAPGNSRARVVTCSRWDSASPAGSNAQQAAILHCPVKPKLGRSPTTVSATTKTWHGCWTWRISPRRWSCYLIATLRLTRLCCALCIRPSKSCSFDGNIGGFSLNIWWTRLRRDRRFPGRAGTKDKEPTECTLSFSQTCVTNAEQWKYYKQS